jgi:drug/metabolite transporter superfamily protein YnfA
MARGREVASLAAEFWDFLRERKKWWLAPIVLVLAVFGALIVFAQGSAVAPFIYTIF